MSIYSKLYNGFRSLRVSEFALAIATCPFCGPSLFIRLNASEAGIRCLRCSASSMHLSIGLAFRLLVPNPGTLDVCELSGRGPFINFLRKACRRVSGSEYFEDVEHGESFNGIRCEDVQCLTYPNNCFDVITHTEVLEHVPDDARAFSELYRVLRPGGIMLFTVPLTELERTIERAHFADGKIEYLLNPIYHADPQRPHSGILAFRDYGLDILDRLGVAGFVETSIISISHRVPWLQARKIIVARRLT